MPCSTQNIFCLACLNTKQYPVVLSYPQNMSNVNSLNVTSFDQTSKDDGKTSIDISLVVCVCTRQDLQHYNHTKIVAIKELLTEIW